MGALDGIEYALSAPPPQAPPTQLAHTAPVESQPDRKALPRRPAGSLKKQALDDGNFFAPSHPLVQSTVAKLHNIMLEAERGDPSRIFDLYDDMRDRDSRLDGVCRTRIANIMSRDVTFVPPPGFEEDREAKRIAREVNEITALIPNWHGNIAKIADGVLRGLSVSEMVWGRDMRGRWAPEIVWRIPQRFTYNGEQRVALSTANPAHNRSRRSLIEEFGPDRFVIHTPTAGRATTPMRRGVLRSAIFPALTKRYGLRWWLVASERFGQPAPVLKIQGNNTETIEDAQAALRELNNDWATVIDKEMDLEQVPGTGNFSGEGHARLVELVNIEHSVVVLGQNLTTEVTGGSHAAANVHAGVMLDHLASDMQELRSTIQRDIIEPIVRYNFGPDAPVPAMTFTLVNSQSREPQEWHFLHNIVGRDDVRGWLGHTPRNDPADQNAEPRPLEPVSPASGDPDPA